MPDEPKPQADKFRDLARELEADEDESHFEDQVRRIVPRRASIGTVPSTPPPLPTVPAVEGPQPAPQAPARRR